jgi:hypothetical protein
MKVYIEEKLLNQMVEALQEVEIKWLCNYGPWNSRDGIPRDQIQGVSDALDAYEKEYGVSLDRGQGDARDGHKNSCPRCGIDILAGSVCLVCAVGKGS